MAARVMAHVRNYFQQEPPVEPVLTGGRLTPDPGVTPGCWLAVEGVGVCRCGQDGLVPLPDGAVTGRVWLLDPPPGFLALCDEIEAWVAAHPRSAQRGERIGEYSREMALDMGGMPLSWQQLFAADMMPYRRMIAEVTL